MDAEVLADLTAEDLIGLGVTSIGHSRKLLAAISALQHRTSLPTTPALDTQPATSEAASLPAEGERRQLTVMSARLEPEEVCRMIGAY
jgi:SAM domain (Sterile alpha motif)